MDSPDCLLLFLPTYYVIKVGRQCRATHCLPTYYIIEVGPQCCSGVVPQLVTSLLLERGVVARLPSQLVTSRQVLANTLKHWLLLFLVAILSLTFEILELMSDSSEYLILSVNRTKNLELGDVSIRRMEDSINGGLRPDPRPGGPLATVD